MKDFYKSLVDAIITQQEYVVGSLAWVEAEKVKGLKVDKKNIRINGEGKKIVELLVAQYENLFGGASVEVCRGAVKNLIVDVEKSKIPDILY